MGKDKIAPKTDDKLQKPKKAPGKPFKKGKDPRRNTKGRPKGAREWKTDFGKTEFGKTEFGKTDFGKADFGNTDYRGR